MIGLLKIRICKNAEICLGLNSVAKVCQKIVIVILAKSDSQANGVVSHLLANRIILAIKNTLKQLSTTRISRKTSLTKFKTYKDIERQRRPSISPQISKIAKVTRLFLLSKKAR